MVHEHAAGVENTAEGSIAATTSKKSELKLTNIAKANWKSCYWTTRTFCATSLALQSNNSSEALAVRRRYQSDSFDQYDPYSIAEATPEVAANTLICLINQTTYLLRRQLEKLDRDFVEHGGFTERLYRARPSSKQVGSIRSKSQFRPAVAKTHGSPHHRAKAFLPEIVLGLPAYPDCTGTGPVDPPTTSGPSNSPDRTEGWLHLPLCKR